MYQMNLWLCGELFFVCLIAASCTLSVKQKIVCVFAIWLLISICLLCIRYYYSLTLSSFFCFFVPNWFNYNHIKSCFVFLLLWRTIEFPKFMLLFLVTVLISWFWWCRVFFVLIISRILFCSPLIICSFLSRNSASVSIFTIFRSSLVCVLLLLPLFCLLSCLDFFS